MLTSNFRFGHQSQPANPSSHATFLLSLAPPSAAPSHRKIQIRSQVHPRTHTHEKKAYHPNPRTTTRFSTQPSKAPHPTSYKRSHYQNSARELIRTNSYLSRISITTMRRWSMRSVERRVTRLPRRVAPGLVRVRRDHSQTIWSKNNSYEKRGKTLMYSRQSRLWWEDIGRTILGLPFTRSMATSLTSKSDIIRFGLYK